MSRTRAAVLALALAAACRAAPAPPSAPTDAMRLADRILAGGIAPAPLELPVSPPSRPANAKAGGDLFAAMNCDGCHGGGAVGWVGPSLTDGRWRYGGSDAEVYTSIYFGQPKGMPAFGGMLQPSAIWDIIAYLRSQPAPANVPTQRF